MLQYGCIMDNSLTPDCPSVLLVNETNETTVLEAHAEATCSPHWAWFGISCTLIVISTLVPAFAWTLGRMAETTCRSSFFCCLGILQLTHVWQLGELFLEMEPSEIRAEDSSFLRNLATAMTESAPQLFLQAYVLFALGAYGQGFKLASVGISIVSLTSSVVMAAAASADTRMKTWKAKAIGMFFIGTDVAVRSMGFAMAFSEPVRAFGTATAGSFFTVCLCYQLCICRRQGTHRGESRARMGLVFLPYLIPATPLIFDKDDYRKTGLEVVLALRYIETVIFGILAGVFGQTACGNSLGVELAVYFSMLVANALALIGFNCFVEKDGTISTPRESSYSPRRILGCAMDPEIDRE